MGHVNKLWQQVYQLMVYLFDDHVSRLQGGAVHSRLCCISVRVVARVRLETLVAHIHTLSFFPALVARTTSEKKDGLRTESHFTIITENTLLRFFLRLTLPSERCHWCRCTKDEEGREVKDEVNSERVTSLLHHPRHASNNRCSAS